jgi:hypothetical protein
VSVIRLMTAAVADGTRSKVRSPGRARVRLVYKLVAGSAHGGE